MQQTAIKINRVLIMRTPPESYVHRPEASFEDNVADWFRAVYGDENVEQQRYQPVPRWYADLYVDTEHIRLFIEVESRASEVRPGVAQAIGYAAADTRFGIPMVIAEVGHLPEPVRLRRLRRGPAIILSFDPEKGIFVDETQGGSVEDGDVDPATKWHSQPDSSVMGDHDPPVPTDKENWKPARKKPVEVDYKGPFYTTTAVDTLEGVFDIDEEYASQGYVLIRGVEDEIYPCRLDIFKNTYKYAL